MLLKLKFIASVKSVLSVICEHKSDCQMTYCPEQEFILSLYNLNRLLVGGFLFDL